MAILSTALNPYVNECNKGIISFSTEEPKYFTGYKICITLRNTENEKPYVLHTALLTADRQAKDFKFTIEKMTSPIEKSVRKIRNMVKSIRNKKPVVLAELEKQYIQRKDLALAYYVNGELNKFWVNKEKIEQLEKDGYKNDLQYKVEGCPINITINTYVEDDSLNKAMELARQFMIDHGVCEIIRMNESLQVPKSWLFTHLKINSQTCYPIESELTIN